MTAATYNELRDFARDAVGAGGEEALTYFRRHDLEVESKQDESPVTRADRSAEACIKAMVRARYPDDAWIGEESGEDGGGSGRCWICDPIDGTKNFINGIPLWATLLACEEDGQVIAAAVAIPGIGEVYDAALGQGAARNGHSIQVRQRSAIEDCLFCFESREWFAKCGLMDVYNYMQQNTRLQRGLGDAYAHMLIASGCADIMIEPSLSVWDIAAPSLIVTEAGGRCTDLDGEASIRSNNALSSNGAVHAELLRILQEHRSS